jgi:putative ABC transport system permease protein
VVIGASRAARFWPDDEAVGRRLWFTTPDGTAQPFVVVGIVNDLPESRPGLEPRDAYLPFAHRPSISPVGVVARAGDDGGQLAARIRQAFRTELPETGFLSVRSIRQELDERLASASVSARAYSVLGLLVFLIAMGGLCGLSAHLAAVRRREIGIRRALGATPAMLCRMLHSEHAYILTKGVAIGCLAGVCIASLLLRSHPTLRLFDPVGITAVAGVLYVAGLVGAVAPFLRTMREGTVQLKE